MKITLVPTRLHWIKDDGSDDPSDLCAHSPVYFEIEGETLVSPSEGDATVSAAAIYLLRTLEREHTKEHPICDHLFPCCGHALYDTGDADVAISGCLNGSDVFVAHNDDSTLRITTAAGNSYFVAETEWRQTVHIFSDAVRAFYDRSLPKTPADEVDADGFARMMAEWTRRRSQT